MPIRNILVAFNGSETSETALHAAMQLHRRYDAHVTGILAHSGQRDRFSRRAWMPENVRSMLSAAVAEDEERVETLFRSLTAEHVPAEKLHWITLYGEPDSTVAQYACMYDLTLVGKYDAVSGRDNADVHPEQIAMQSGRPVLMVPARPAEGSLHRRAVLAWDGQRAATRALNDAMQLLEADQPVDVISIGDRHVRPPLKGVDVVKALARHDVAATRIRKSEVTDSVGADLLSYCKEVDAGLLVMGAFERSVFREELFGGTTKHVLMHAELPVLISH